MIILLRWFQIYMPIKCLSQEEEWYIIHCIFWFWYNLYNASWVMLFNKTQIYYRNLWKSFFLWPSADIVTEIGTMSTFVFWHQPMHTDACTNPPLCTNRSENESIDKLLTFHAEYSLLVLCCWEKNVKEIKKRWQNNHHYLAIWLQSYEGLDNATKEFEHCFCQYLKNNIANIRLIPLDHVTIRLRGAYTRNITQQ